LNKENTESDIIEENTIDASGSYRYDSKRMAEKIIKRERELKDVDSVIRILKELTYKQNI
jgi:hypothetical protein